MKKIDGISDMEKSLSTVNKWKIYPQLSINKSIDKNSLDYLKSIFRLRNMIIHKKAELTYVGDDPKNIPFLLPNAYMMINKVNYIIRDLISVDNTVRFNNLSEDFQEAKDWSKKTVPQ